MLITIASYSFPFEAHIARSRLESEEIPAFVADEHTINMQWLYSNALGGVRLQVPEEFVEVALEILSEDREQDLVEEVGVDATPARTVEARTPSSTRSAGAGPFWFSWGWIFRCFRSGMAFGVTTVGRCPKPSAP